MYFNKIIPELSVTNLENSIKFYKTIGFKIEYERPENKFAFLSLGEIQFMLQEITDNDKWDEMGCSTSYLSFWKWNQFSARSRKCR